MHLIDVPTERTTAATDVLVAALALGCAAYVRAIGRRDPWKTGLWSATFGLLVVSAALGAVAHGLEMPTATYRMLWHPIYLGLGLTVAMFAAAAVYDLWGRNAARRALPLAVAAGVGFYIATRFFAGSFLVFIVYEAAVMVFALAGYGVLALRRRLRGAGLMSAGIAITLIAAAIQADPAVSLRLVWPFDSNGVFHLVQMIGIVVLTAGLRAALISKGSV